MFPNASNEVHSDFYKKTVVFWKRAKTSGSFSQNLWNMIEILLNNSRGKSQGWNDDDETCTIIFPLFHGVVLINGSVEFVFLSSHDNTVLTVRTWKSVHVACALTHGT